MYIFLLCKMYSVYYIILFIQKLKGELKSDCTFKLIDDLPPQKIEDEICIPKNLASFKLDLQDNEKKAKEELILPYTLYVINISDKKKVIIIQLLLFYFFQSTKCNQYWWNDSLYSR